MDTLLKKLYVVGVCLQVGQTQVVGVDWLRNLANYKEDYNVMLCARS